MVKKRLIIVGFLVGLAVTIYLFSHKPSAPTAPLLQPAASQTSAGPVSGDIVAKVGKLMLLPQGEVPTIALVKDLAPLKGQVFFANAKLGDVVLMYGKAQRAILYRPSADKIIEVGPITTH